MEQELNLSSLRVDREVLTELVIWAYDHEEITQSRAAEILGIPLVEFRSCYFEWLKPKDL
jgi:predicted HTH domain antitoxin